MSIKLYVGNLSWDTQRHDLESAFGRFGEIQVGILLQPYAKHLSNLSFRSRQSAVSLLGPPTSTCSGRLFG